MSTPPLTISPHDHTTTQPINQVNPELPNQPTCLLAPATLVTARVTAPAAAVDPAPTKLPRHE
ncbi:hypothetical protein P153DRAFT_363748 [Dothidotthia symphoricarpi CBS 119687]|uniref:Uncharacterized protein n=1 Tax=Dothidotthia symphoricarpi CBS 119687 TaxID=1392245 RepID=A0A6A6ANK7_9PLEO|nr:uncharacterized protein P153DRAFT_363748 [Dothidotthia symphoricarpi CBS 119687]KAF2133582.1 hypothetical protein P153DRAFT_363748 [Dothidotthia symphoricarpi CBS 119687]